MCYSKVCIALLVVLNMHIYRNKTTKCIIKNIGIFMCHLPLTKGEENFSCQRSSFLSAKSKHQTIHNKHAFKQSFKKYDMHGMQHESRHNICMICKLLREHKINQLAGLWSRSNKANLILILLENI